MENTQVEPSNALKLLSLVWDHCDNNSWERLNHSMRNALELAVGSGLSFNASDFTVMSDRFRWGGMGFEC